MKRGRPKIGHLRRVTLTLDAETIRKARALGMGNLSHGVRAAVLAVVLPAPTASQSA